MSARLTVMTEEAVSASERRMLLPVISTRWTGLASAGGAVSWASAGAGSARIARPTAPPPANRRRIVRARNVSFSSVAVMSRLQKDGETLPTQSKTAGTDSDFCIRSESMNDIAGGVRRHTKSRRIYATNCLF
jgi:hypothetical protein